MAGALHFQRKPPGDFRKDEMMAEKRKFFKRLKKKPRA
jgi:hypothetical protein